MQESSTQGRLKLLLMNSILIYSIYREEEVSAAKHQFTSTELKEMDHKLLQPYIDGLHFMAESYELATSFTMFGKLSLVSHLINVF